MKRHNLVGLDSRLGYRTIELLEGDVCDLSPKADVLVVSAFASSYVPTSGTVIGALKRRFGIDSQALEQAPAIDLRSGLGVWLSKKLEVGPATRLLFVELVGGTLSFEEALGNVFSALLLFSAKGLTTDRVALPLLGAGDQRLDPVQTSAVLLTKARAYLERAIESQALQFVEIDGLRVQAVSAAMDETLGRVRVTLPHEVLTQALRDDVHDKLASLDGLFSGGGRALRDDWMRLLSGEHIRSVEVGVHGRRLVELMLNRLGVPQQVLAQRIRHVEQHQLAAPWICGYMNVLRHLGNESAHESQSPSTRVPPTLGPQDVVAALMCVERLLGFWRDREGQPAA